MSAADANWMYETYKVPLRFHWIGNGNVLHAFQVTRSGAPWFYSLCGREPPTGPLAREGVDALTCKQCQRVLDELRK